MCCSAPTVTHTHTHTHIETHTFFFCFVACFQQTTQRPTLVSPPNFLRPYWNHSGTNPDMTFVLTQLISKLVYIPCAKKNFFAVQIYKIMWLFIYFYFFVSSSPWVYRLKFLSHLRSPAWNKSQSSIRSFPSFPWVKVHYATLTYWKSRDTVLLFRRYILFILYTKQCMVIFFSLNLYRVGLYVCLCLFYFILLLNRRKYYLC